MHNFAGRPSPLARNECWGMRLNEGASLHVIAMSALQGHKLTNRRLPLLLNEKSLLAVCSLNGGLVRREKPGEKARKTPEGRREAFKIFPKVTLQVRTNHVTRV